MTCTHNAKRLQTASLLLTSLSLTALPQDSLFCGRKDLGLLIRDPNSSMGVTYGRPTSDPPPQNPEAVLLDSKVNGIFFAVRSASLLWSSL